MNAPLTPSVSRAAVNALFGVIYRLRDTAPLDAAAAEALRARAHVGAGDAARPHPEDAFHAQVLQIDAALDRWFLRGETPPTDPVNQIAHTLRRAGKKELERAFLAVWGLHFRLDRDSVDAPAPQGPGHDPVPRATPPSPFQAADEPQVALAEDGLDDDADVLVAPVRTASVPTPDDVPPAGLRREQPAPPGPPPGEPAKPIQDAPFYDFHTAIEAELFGGAAGPSSTPPDVEPPEARAPEAFDDAGWTDAGAGSATAPASEAPPADSGAENAATQDIGASVLGGAVSGDTSSLRNMINGTEEVSDYWRVPPVILMALGGVPPTNIALVPIQGDSMIPTFLDGDVAVIDTRHRLPSPDGIYALNDAFGGIVIKRLKVIANPDDKFPMVQVISDNARYEPRQLYLDEIQVVGRVLRKFGHVS